MTTFFQAIAELSIQPFGLAVLLLSAGGGLVGWLRIRKLNSILKDLVSLPAAKRLYKLEREYKIHPGRDAKPLRYVRRLRRIWLVATVSAGCVIVAGFVGVALREAAAAAGARLEVRDMAVTPEGQGYVWRVELVNSGSRIVVVDAMRLRVLRVRKREGKPRPLPADTGSREIPVVKLGPKTVMAPLLKLDQREAVAPGDRRVVAFAVKPDHRPREGWSYQVRFELRWHGAGNVISHSESGKTYRLSWPGLLHWSESGPPRQRSHTPVAEPATVVSPGH